MATFDQQQHPITPPPELVEQWINEPGGLSAVHVATQAARWGADQELQALLIWLRYHHYDHLASDILAAMRPNPPSLAEQALALLGSLHADLKMHGLGTETGVIRAALERLQELENNG